MAAPAPPDGATWRARARRFAEEVVQPIAAEIDRTDRAPPELARRLAEAGLLGVGLDPRWGGAGGDTRAVSGVLEELARASAAVATLVSVHISVCAQPIERWATDAQRETYLRPLATGRWLGAFALTEPGAGSDSAGIGCRYRRDGDGYRLDGSKTFITNGGLADLLLTFARASDGPAEGRISAFLLRRGSPGFTAPGRLEKLGLHGSETNELHFDDVRLPSEALLGAEGRGLSVALGALTAGRVGIASCALGVAQAAFEEVQALARAEPEAWRRALLARSYARLAAARALVADAAARKDRGESFLLESSAAKLTASEAACWIAEQAVDLAGAAGVRAGARAGRLLRDARVFPIVEGTTEIQELILGRSLIEGSGP
jgi:alkylation response protein AidB-like acyl-CoA dehydrogenase